MNNADELAYPELKYSVYRSDHDRHYYESEGGLTKRERLAMAAMQGICANPKFTSDTAQNISRWAVAQADSLLKELEQTND